MAFTVKQKGVAEGIGRGIEQGIKAFILDNLEERKTEEEILMKLEKRFSLSREKAKYYFDCVTSV